jgi:hypothetical protein
MSTAQETGDEFSVNVKGNRRQSAQLKETNVIRIAARHKESFQRISGITQDHNVPVESADHSLGVDQARGAADQAGLLGHFTDDGLFRSLPHFHETAGQAPESEAGINTPSDKQNAAFLKQNGRDGGSRVQVDNMSARGTYRALATVMGLQTERSAALRAELGQPDHVTLQPKTTDR